MNLIANNSFDINANAKKINDIPNSQSPFSINSKNNDDNLNNIKRFSLPNQQKVQNSTANLNNFVNTNNNNEDINRSKKVSYVEIGVERIQLSGESITDKVNTNSNDSSNMQKNSLCKFDPKFLRSETNFYLFYNPQQNKETFYNKIKTYFYDCNKNTISNNNMNNNQLLGMDIVIKPRVSQKKNVNSFLNSSTDLNNIDTKKSIRRHTTIPNSYYLQNEIFYNMERTSDICVEPSKKLKKRSSSTGSLKYNQQKAKLIEENNNSRKRDGSSMNSYSSGLSGVEFEEFRKFRRESKRKVKNFNYFF